MLASQPQDNKRNIQTMRKLLYLAQVQRNYCGVVLRTRTSGTSSIAFADNSGSGSGAQDGLIEYSKLIEQVF